MRHANTQSGILYTRQHQHLQASGDGRRVSGVRAAVCVARSRLRCEEVLCCGCRLMWMPSELEDDSPSPPAASESHTREPEISHICQSEKSDLCVCVGCNVRRTVPLVTLE